MIEDDVINAIRVVSAQLPSIANSGHPGAPIGCSPILYILYTKFMKYNPNNPGWWNRDRFVLSNGHASALLYTMLYLTGYNLTLDDLKSFRKLNSKTPGHPENFKTEGVEVTTGPLGQGIANAVGMAIATKNLAAIYNQEGYELFNNLTFCLCGDGCLQEGISSEASSLAGHLKLGNLILLYDDNGITIDGSTELSFTEDVLKRYESYGWHTARVINGDSNLSELEVVINNAILVKDQPSIIAIKTTIGYGSPHQNTNKVHGSPLNKEEINHLKKKFNIIEENLLDNFPIEYREYICHIEKGNRQESNWNNIFIEFKAEYPQLAAELNDRFSQKVNLLNVRNSLPDFTQKFSSDIKVSTRLASKAIINSLNDSIPSLIGGSADLSASCLTCPINAKDFSSKDYSGRQIRFGIREHAMGGICNGIYSYGGFIPFCSTFLNFISYCYPSVRLSALSQFQVLYIMTHDSIGLGEDGPTHQPVAMLPLLRATPNLLTIRPADVFETSGAYLLALSNINRPSVVVLSRQNLPILHPFGIDKVSSGAYCIYQPDGIVDAFIIASGSEVHLAINSAKSILKNLSLYVSVISCPCLEIFEEQDHTYKLSLFKKGIPVLSLEASSSNSWGKYAHSSIAVDTFGVSSSGEDAFKYFNFTVESISNRIQQMVQHYGINAPDLLDRI